MNSENKSGLLAGLDGPEDLRRLPDEQMKPLCQEIRRFLVGQVTRTGGHLASNLGVVELSVALHRVFNTPADRVIWDVGHQSYVHKLLTGRRERFDTLRTPGGLSGFTRRQESEYDPFGAGHSSTSVSAALGFAEADRLRGSDAYTVAVVGDGAFSGGMIYEALNNCRSDLNLVIVLNENEMSIAPTGGRMAGYLSRIRTSKRYRHWKVHTRGFLRRIPLIGKPLYRRVKRIKRFFKNQLYHSNYFEELGLYYIGPVDGNDYPLMERALRAAREKGGSVLVHIKTQKGKGYDPAEAHPDTYHNVSAQKAGDSFHRQMGAMLTRLGEQDPAIVAVTAAMGQGTGLDTFGAAFPERYFDVGIAEEHALTFSAGLAAAGLKPFCAIYSTFLQRGYDNILHDIALQNLPVRLLIDRAGLAVADGSTHHGIFDVAFLSHIPGISLYQPVSYAALQAMLGHLTEASSPCAVRYPNEAEKQAVIRHFYPDGDPADYAPRADYEDPAELDALMITYGSITARVLEAQTELKKQGVRCGVILIQQLCPYDRTVHRLLGFLRAALPVVFVEEGIYEGGAGMIVGDLLRQLHPSLVRRYRVLALHDFVSPEKPVDDLYAYCGLDAAGIRDAVLNLLGGKS